MKEELRTKYDQFLHRLAAEVDISPSKYQQAVARYAAVGKWLSDCKYDGCYSESKIYPQGSFRLGTVVRPTRSGKEADYDIDLVCELQKDKLQTTPKIVKHEIGMRLEEHTSYKEMLEPEGSRCWTMNYAEEDGIGFHLDVLPSIPEETNLKSGLIRAGIAPIFADQAIAITHKGGNNIYFWSPGNPNGYADWFHSLNRPAFTRVAIGQKKALFENYRTLYENIDSVPDQLIRTPLQVTIQILKHHRDKRFAGHKFEEDKPISMIITTLAARFYENEENVLSALQNISSKIYEHARLLDPGYGLDEKLAARKIISRTQDGKWCLPNPVNPDENFADRWHEDDHRKARAFFQWAAWVRDDLIDVLNKGDGQKITDSLAQSFGDRVAKTASSLFMSAPVTSVFSQQAIPRVQIKNPSRPWGFR